MRHATIPTSKTGETGAQIVIADWPTLVGVTIGALPEQDQREALDRRDIAFTPVAMPLLSGPGSIAVTISMATSVEHATDFIPVCLGIVVVAFISWLVLRSSSRIINVLGSSGVNVLTRIMGLILVCVGIQFVANGFIELLTDEAIATILMEAYPG